MAEAIKIAGSIAGIVSMVIAAVVACKNHPDLFFCKPFVHQLSPSPEDKKCLFCPPESN
ncbi:MAG: hypothetical protein F6J86_31255 [Symploca sp. SIO1B1]|nr:hypothetical protein [Symploca sp. SIO1B1]